MRPNIGRMDTRKVVYYAMFAAYVVFLVLSLLRMQRVDDKLAAIEARTGEIRDRLVTTKGGPL